MILILLKIITNVNRVVCMHNKLNVFQRIFHKVKEILRGKKYKTTTKTKLNNNKQTTKMKFITEASQQNVH